MSSADLVQRKGVGPAFVALMEARMLASSSAVERWAPRRRALSVGGAKKRSARLSQGAEVGVWCTCQRGRLANQPRISLALRMPAWSMTRWTSGPAGTAAPTASRNRRDAAARRAAGDDGSRLDAGGGGQRGRAVAGAAVGAPPGLAGTQRQERLRAVE